MPKGDKELALAFNKLYSYVKDIYCKFEQKDVSEFKFSWDPSGTKFTSNAYWYTSAPGYNNPIETASIQLSLMSAPKKELAIAEPPLIKITYKNKPDESGYPTINQLEGGVKETLMNTVIVVGDYQKLAENIANYNSSFYKGWSNDMNNKLEIQKIIKEAFQPFLIAMGVEIKAEPKKEVQKQEAPDQSTPGSSGP